MQFSLNELKNTQLTQFIGCDQKDIATRTISEMNENIIT